MKQLRLQTKLYISHLILAVLILFSFTFFFYRYISSEMLDEAMENLQETNRSLMTQTESLLKDMDTVSINLNYSNLLKDKLDENFQLNLSKDNLKALADLFYTINGTDNRVDFIYLYDFDGNVLQCDTGTKITHVSPDSLSWLDTVVENNGAKFLSSPRYLSSRDFSGWYISLYRTFMNPYQRPVGVIETMKECKKIFQPILSYQKKSSSPVDIYVYDSAGALIYPYDPENVPDSISDYFSQTADFSEPAIIQNTATGVRELVSCKTSAYSSWSYVTVRKERDVLQPIHAVLYMLLLFAFAMLLISSFISHRLSRSLVKPIKHLKHIIQRMRVDTLGSETTNGYPTSVNEITELYRAFEDMNKTLRTSMNELIETKQQEMKSRTLALQSQMNPHFYYNSLSNVIVLAENQQTDEIIKMCRNLTSIMRYITNTGSTVTTLKEEIDYVEKYLSCIKIRYRSSLNYTIQVPEALLEKPVPKLILQPLVENAVKYGTDQIPPWSISVQGQIEESGWALTVTDSGNGFSEESMALIKKRIETALQNPGMPDIQIHGMGLLNVFLRWHLFCPGECQFQYGNTPEHHAYITLRKEENKTT